MGSDGTECSRMQGLNGCGMLVCGQYLWTWAPLDIGCVGAYGKVPSMEHGTQICLPAPATDGCNKPHEIFPVLTTLCLGLLKQLVLAIQPSTCSHLSMSCGLKTPAASGTPEPAQGTGGTWPDQLHHMDTLPLSWQVTGCFQKDKRVSHRDL